MKPLTKRQKRRRLKLMKRFALQALDYVEKIVKNDGLTYPQAIEAVRELIEETTETVEREINEQAEAKAEVPTRSFVIKA